MTGCDDPSNQLESFSTLPSRSFRCVFSSVSSMANSAASAGEAAARRGEDDREDPKNGRKVEDRVGECDGLLEGRRGGMSTVVLERE